MTRPERHVRGVEQFHHPRAGRGFPEFAGDGFFEVLLRRVMLDEEKRLLVGVAVLQDEIGAKRFAEVRPCGFHAGRNGLAFGKELGADIPASRSSTWRIQA